MRDTLLSVSVLSQVTGNWSKWGGRRISLISLVAKDEWYCQNCGKMQTKNMPSYMLPIDLTNRDFAKVCTMCKKKFLLLKLTVFFELKSPIEV